MNWSQEDKDFAAETLYMLDEHGWWGGEQVQDKTHKYCLGQAMQAAWQKGFNLEYDPTQQAEMDWTDIPLYCHVTEHLRGIDSDYYSVPTWNDMSDRTEDEVRALLKEIIIS